MRSSTSDSFVKAKNYVGLTPRLKMNLTFECLRKMYTDFKFFFNDIQTGVRADKVFVRKILTNFFSSMHTPGDDLISAGQNMQCLCFIQKGSVLVSDLFNRFYITSLSKGSYFGDY